MDFRSDLKEAVLAKLMLAERFAPEVFDAIALDLDADGKSVIVAELEESTPTSGTKKKTSKKGDDVGASRIGDWPNIEWAKRWGRIRFPLADVDLRPYFFVSRDRRGAFAGGVLVGPIESMVERLSSTPMAIRTVPATDLQGLSAPDAERVFHALAAKIDATEDLSTRPPAADGLARLCGARPELHGALMTFLGRLPTATIGGWVVTGWGAAVQGAQSAAFVALVKAWSEIIGNDGLSKIAALELAGGKMKAR